MAHRQVAANFGSSIRSLGVGDAPSSRLYSQNIDFASIRNGYGSSIRMEVESDINASGRSILGGYVSRRYRWRSIQLRGFTIGRAAVSGISSLADKERMCTPQLPSGVES
jgi:hypothetical protein